jgi:serine/threonine protein kinase
MIGLSHVNLVQYIDFKADAVYIKPKKGSQEAVDYIVEELLDGKELFDYVAEIGGFEASICRNIMNQCLDALDYIHSHGMCHRDLKLENIMIEKSGRVKLIDFGMA